MGALLFLKPNFNNIQRYGMKNNLFQIILYYKNPLENLITLKTCFLIKTSTLSDCYCFVDINHAKTLDNISLSIIILIFLWIAGCLFNYTS